MTAPTALQTLCAYLNGIQQGHGMQNDGQELHIHGDLYISDEHARNTARPDSMDAVVFGSTITELPPGLVVLGNLKLYRSPINNLPPDIRIAHDVDIYESSLESLPDGFRVHGNLDLAGSAISVLPEGLWVKGNLDLRRTNVTRLPQTFSVGGIIHPSGCMHDIIAFMEHKREATMLRMPQSQHGQMEIRDSMHAFPDLVRIILSLGPERELRLWYQRLGKYAANIP